MTDPSVHAFLTAKIRRCELDFQQARSRLPGAKTIADLVRVVHGKPTIPALIRCMPEARRAEHEFRFAAEKRGMDLTYNEIQSLEAGLFKPGSRAAFDQFKAHLHQLSPLMPSVTRSALEMVHTLTRNRDRQEAHSAAAELDGADESNISALRQRGF